MSRIEGWAQEIEDRLNRVCGDRETEQPSPSTPFTEHRFISPTSSLFGRDFVGSPSPFPSEASCELNPLFHEDPEFELLQSPFPVHALNLDLPDPPPPMASIREQNGHVNGENGAPSNITYPAVAVGKSNDFELRSGFLHELPKFHGLSGEDPNSHLKLFQFTCDSMCPRGADPQLVKMRAFPFSLDDKARRWIFEVPTGRITSWNTMVNEFLLKYFPASRVTQLRSQITGIRQANDEPFGDYYD